MTRKKKIIIGSIFVALSIMILVVKVNAYDVTEVEYIWDYLEKDTFFTDALRGLGWFIYVTSGAFLDLCYETFTSIAKFNILEIPIVDTVIKNLDTLTPYILVITVAVVLVVRLFDIKNIGKVFINMVVVAMLMATFSHILVLVDDLKTVGIEESANVIGVEDYRISDSLLADNTVDVKKSLDNGSVQYLSKDDVTNFHHDLRLSKDYLDEDIVDRNEDGTYNTESLSDGIWGIGDVHFYRYKTDYWALNITAIVSIVVYIMASFKMGYLMAQWLQENIFGGALMIKGVWDIHSLGKIFKSILSTVFAIIEVYFMMLFFSYYCANVMSNSELTNWMSKVILIYAMGMMIIAGSGFINDSLGIDDGSNFMLRSLIVGRRMSQAAKAPFRMASNAAAAGVTGIKAVSSGTSQIGSHLSSRYAGLLSNVSNMNAPESPPAFRSSPAPAYDSNGNENHVSVPHTRENDKPLRNIEPYKGTTPNYSKNTNESNGNPNTSESLSEDNFTNSKNDSLNDLKDKYNESNLQEKKYFNSNVATANEMYKGAGRDMLKNSRSGGNSSNVSTGSKNNTVSANPEHVKRMNDIANGNIGKNEPESMENEHRYPTAEELDDMIESLNEWDQKGGNR